LLKPPAFWNHDGPAWPQHLLAPLSPFAARATARRVARPGWTAPVPVICCGNATVGGAGKTTLALDIGRRLLARGHRLAFLTRGFGGAAAHARRVLPGDAAAAVGDEALLLADLAPTFVGADRAASARAAIAAGADRLVMDDGLQNPTLAKTLSLLVIDGAAGFGNGRVLPAGPLREPAAAAAARCAAAVLIGEDTAAVRSALPSTLPVLAARLVSSFVPAGVGGRPLLAFAGIGRPEKFFDSLEQAGAALVGRIAFPDHHRYRPTELRKLLDDARRLGAVPVTTPKDAVRLPADIAAQVTVIGVDLVWNDAQKIEAMLP
jgi:tetraacyldisaccharide 4'-kinase